MVAVGVGVVVGVVVAVGVGVVMTAYELFLTLSFLLAIVAVVNGERCKKVKK